MITTKKSLKEEQLLSFWRKHDLLLTVKPLDDKYYHPRKRILYKGGKKLSKYKTPEDKKYSECCWELYRTLPRRIHGMFYYDYIETGLRIAKVQVLSSKRVLWKKLK